MAVRELGFRVEVVGDSTADWPSVTILVDGEDVIGRATGFRGFDPDDIFGRGAPLVPQDPPRRVAVYRCSCGEPGCGCAACLITRDAALVRWTDFRDYTGVYARPLVDAEPDGGARQPVPDLEFDAVQYGEAVRRASEDRSWETRRRRRARLLRSELVTAHSHFEALGYTIGWVAPEGDDENGVQVELRVPNGQVVLRLDADPDVSDEESARKMAAWLLKTPERRWNVQHRNTWPSASR
ncbi:MAG TPA: hypothetical protein VHN37_09680 [Actinomycetota bacterium]|nr:hypothetical protein [Actinomycetota bacterium]